MHALCAATGFAGGTAAMYLLLWTFDAHGISYRTPSTLGQHLRHTMQVVIILGMGNAVGLALYLVLHSYLINRWQDWVDSWQASVKSLLLCWLGCAGLLVSAFAFLCILTVVAVIITVF